MCFIGGGHGGGDGDLNVNGELLQDDRSSTSFLFRSASGLFRGRSSAAAAFVLPRPFRRVLLPTHAMCPTRAVATRELSRPFAQPIPTCLTADQLFSHHPLIARATQVELTARARSPANSNEGSRPRTSITAMSTANSSGGISWGYALRHLDLSSARIATFSSSKGASSFFSTRSNSLMKRKKWR